MPGPGGREVGRVSVRALPDTSSFARSLERYLDRVERRLQVEIPVDLASGDVAATEATLAELTRDRKVEVEVDIDRSVVDRLGGILGGISGGGGGAGGLLGGAGSIGKLSTVAGLLAGIVVAGNIAGGLIAALPGMLAAVVAPIGAIVLGFEGIKDAAVLLAEPFQELRDTVANVFRFGLAPVFRELRDIFPTLTQGFSAVAGSLVKMADAVTGALTSDRGLGLIGSTFDHIADAMAIIAPALGPLTDTLLTLANEGAAAFERWAPRIADVIEGFNGIIRKLEESGDLAKAFDVLGGLITGAIALFGALVVWSVWSLARISDVATTIGNALKGIGRAVDTVTGGISRAFDTMGRLIAAATRGDWGTVREIIGNAVGVVTGLAGRLRDRVVAAVTTMADRVLAKATDIARGMVARLASLPGDLHALAIRALARMLDGAQNGAGRVLGFVAGLPGRIRNALGGIGTALFSSGVALIQGLISGIRYAAGQVADVAAAVVRGAIAAARAAAGIRSPSTVFRGIGQNIGEGLMLGIGDTEDAVQRSFRSLVTPRVSAPSLGDGTTSGGGTGFDNIAEGLIALDKRLVAIQGTVGDLPRQSRDIARAGRGRS